MEITRTKVVKKVSTPLVFEKYSKQTDHPDAYVKTALVMEALKLKSENLGAKLLFVIIPAKEQVNPEYAAELFKKLGVDNLPVNLTKVNKFLESTCQDHEITCIDLLPYFLNHSDPASLYYENNDHWNEAGQFYAASIISKELIEKSIIG